MILVYLLGTLNVIANIIGQECFAVFVALATFASRTTPIFAVDLKDPIAGSLIVQSDFLRGILSSRIHKQKLNIPVLCTLTVVVGAFAGF